MKNSKKIIFSFLTLFLFLLIFDRVLGVFKFPVEITDFFTNKANTTQYIKWIDKYITLTTNKRGIRYPDIPDQKESPNEIRVLVIGDSFTEGQGVQAEDTWAAHLEKKFSNPQKTVRFINGGVTGASPFEYINLFYYVGLKYHPDKLLVMLYANDMEGAPRINTDVPNWENDVFDDYEIVRPRTGIKLLFYEFFPRIYTLIRKAWLRYWVYRDQTAPPKRQVINRIMNDARQMHIPESRIKEWRANVPKKVEELVEGGWLSDASIAEPLDESHICEQMFDRSAPEAERNHRIMNTILSKMVFVCRQRKMKVAFVYAPHAYQYDPSFDTLPQKLGLIVKKEWLTEETKLEKQIAQWADSEHVPYLNLTPYFREQVKRSQESLNFHIDPHWNPAGHTFAAQTIEKWLREIWPELN